MPTEGNRLSPAITERLDALVVRGQVLEREGLPFPTEQIRRAVEALSSQGSEEAVLQVIKRGENLYSVAARDWAWIKQSLERAEELRELAASIGLDVGHLETRVGNPRAQLQKGPLSVASLGRAGASASLAVAVLSDAIPKYVVQEAQKLGVTIRAARSRGEDVREAVGIFSKLLQDIQDQHPVSMTRSLIDVRRAIGRIPRAPSVAAIPTEEEEEILLEARNLARRLQRIKSRARNAQSAARLMTQVRAALAEDRRTGTPEEEIEALWTEVDRLTRERARVVSEAASEPAEVAVAPGSPKERPPAMTVPPEEVAAPELDGDDGLEPARPRARLRPRP